MNALESEMVILLKDLKKNYGAVGVKAEFEAEGTRIEELQRLKEICLRADVSLTLKIGGCEAIRDMYDARIIGVDYLVAPMIETQFSLRKYLKAIELVFPKEEQEKIDFLINVETRDAVRNFDEMLKIPEINGLDGIVIGRVDLVGSMGLDRKSVNNEDIFKITKEVLTKAKKQKMSCVVGGAISAESILFLKNIPANIIDRYETRKICFHCPDALKKEPEKGILNAVKFELLWLKNKKNYYKRIAEEDDARLAMLEERFKKSASNTN